MLAYIVKHNKTLTQDVQALLPNRATDRTLRHGILSSDRRYSALP
jgi:hypothetical protein